MSTWTKISEAVDITDDAAIANVTLKTGITDPATDPDVSEGDLLIEYMSNGRCMAPYIPSSDPDPSIVNRRAFEERRQQLIAQHECVYARERILADDSTNNQTPQKYFDRAAYMNDLLDLPESQANFSTVIASSEFDLETDIDWPTEPS